jgi:hypothetical protein
MGHGDASISVGDAPDDSTRRQRRNLLLGAVALAGIAAAGGLLLSSPVESPRQLAARAAPPGPTRLTAPVQRQVIAASVVAQGVVGQPRRVSQVPGSGGVPAGGNPAGSDAQPVVTRIFRQPGARVRAGTVILEIAARPVFVLRGSVPAYRNLMPGEAGRDVAQLQAGLAALGHPHGGDARGVFGPGTSAALAGFYRHLGYPARVISAGRKARRGAWVPLDEIMFVPRLPARVASLGARVGGAVRGPAVTLSAGHPVVRGQLSPADQPLVRAGMSVRITNQLTGASISGTVTSVGTRVRTRNSISGGAYLRLRVRPDRPLPQSASGQSVTLSISAARSGGPVLAVPEAAVFASASGETYVSKVTGRDSQVRVAVRAGTSGDGLVQVTPDSGVLSAGDMVVTGEDYARPVARRAGS